MDQTRTKKRFWFDGKLEGKMWDSRITSESATGKERWLGNFFGPGLVYVAYFILGGSYLNTYYTDIVDVSGRLLASGFLVALPIISKIIDAITNVIMGQIIDRTRCKQGKVRPWMLVSAPMLVISSILLFAIPQLSPLGQAIWIAISYNLFFAFAFTIYNMSAQLSAPLSSRVSEDRDKTALFFNVGYSMVPGIVGTMLFPVFFSGFMGTDPHRWTLVMSIIGVLCLPGVLLEYFFTKERITESVGEGEKAVEIPLGKQIKACFSDKYWVIFFFLILLFQFTQTCYTNVALYYARWVAAANYTAGDSTYALMNAVGQSPLGIGVLLIWPLAKRFGKRRVYVVGMLISSIFCAATFAVSLMTPTLGTILPAMFMRSIGLLPTFLNAAIMGEAMDHIEYKFGYRCDGFTGTVNSIMITIMQGVAIGLLNLGLGVTNYVSPAAQKAAGIAEEAICQGAATKNWISAMCFAIPAVGYVIMAFLASRFTIDDNMEEIQAAIEARHVAEAAARGEHYVTMAEKTAIEEAKAEEKRIAELKAKCEKKGLSFESENRKFLDKKAKTDAKNAAAAAKRRAKAEAKAAKHRNG